jgi:ceramide glucosyltransferase
MFALLPLAICTIATLVCVYAVRRATAPRAPATPATPPVTVLKPLCGADEELRASLATFFTQDYPDYELVFGVVSQADPAIPVVRELMATFPGTRARLVVHDGNQGLNPKVANLRGMIAAADVHDHLVISDSNIAVGPGYLRSMVSRLEPGVELVTSLIRGAEERTLGSVLEGLHLAGSVAGAVAAAEALSGDALLVGKSVLFRRSVFEKLGGMETLAAVLAEDYVMGRMFTEAGYGVRVATEVVRNVTARASLYGFVRRQARWALLRSRLAPLVYPFEPLLNPVAAGLLAVAFGAPAPLVFAWVVLLGTLRDGVSALLLGTSPAAAALAPLKDLLVLAAWAAAPFKRRVSWRGRRFRVSAGTRLYAQGHWAADLPMQRL